MEKKRKIRPHNKRRESPCQGQISLIPIDNQSMTFHASPHEWNIVFINFTTHRRTRCLQHVTTQSKLSLWPRVSCTLQINCSSMIELGRGESSQLTYGPLSPSDIIDEPSPEWAFIFVDCLSYKNTFYIGPRQEGERREWTSGGYQTHLIRFINENDNGRESGRSKGNVDVMKMSHRS